MKSSFQKRNCLEVSRFYKVSTGTTKLFERERLGPLKSEYTETKRLDVLTKTLNPGDEYSLMVLFSNLFEGQEDLFKFYLGYSLNEEAIELSKLSLSDDPIASSFYTIFSQNPFLPLQVDWFLKPLLHVPESNPNDPSISLLFTQAFAFLVSINGDSEPLH
jgi:hypothetical protein